MLKYGKVAALPHRKQYRELQRKSQPEAASFSCLCGKAEALGFAHNNWKEQVACGWY